MMFDKYIKDTLKNYASPVSEEVWKRIVAEQRKRKPVFYWANTKLHIIAGLLIIFGLIGFFATLHWQQNNVTAKYYSASNNQYSINEEQPNVIPNNIIISQEQTNKTPTTVEVEAWSKEKNNQPFNKATNNIVALKHNSKKVVTPSKKVANEQENIVTNTTFSSKHNLIEHQQNNDELINDNTTNTEYTVTQPSIVLLPAKQLTIFSPTVLNTTKKKIKIPAPYIDCPGESNSYKKNWYIEGFVAPEYVTKKVIALDPNSTYMQRKDSAEKMIMGITLGARVTRGLSKNLYVKTGLQFSQLIEKMNFRYESERKEITVITIRTETDINGNTVTISDTTKQIQISYGNNVRYNLYRNLELPISLGYEFYNKGFRASVNAGLIVNLASWYQGKLLDTSFQLVSAKENSGVYKHSVGLSMFGSVSLIKPINDNVDIFAEPYFRYNLSQPKYNSYGFKQKFSAAGISLGVRFKLNHKTRLSINN
ncbi:MAG: hypothetical protein KF781_01720 [Chitinophagaceae bacterium]|nr:hypothetical protein [Chitinophagaceae bacterium]MCW5905454.1 hypothetical protein [Chitinophagaceae bacterium]